MKKFISKAFTLLIAFGLFMGATIFGSNVLRANATDTATITVESISTPVELGADVTLSVTIANNPGFAGATFDIEYDTNVLTPKTKLVTIGSAIKAAVDAEETDMSLVGNTSAQLSAVNDCFSGNGEILKFNFTVKADAVVSSTVVSLKLNAGLAKNFNDINGDAIPVSFVSGTIALNVSTGAKEVTFYGSDLETSIDTLNVAFDSTLENATLPTVTAPEGKVFAGWYTSKPTNDGAKVTPNTVLDVHDKVRDNLSVYPVFIAQGNEAMLEATDGSISACSTFKAAIDGASPAATSSSIIRLVDNVYLDGSGSCLIDISFLTYFHVDLNGHSILGNFTGGSWECYIFKMESQLTGFTFENTKSAGVFNPYISGTWNGVFGIPSWPSPTGAVTYTFANICLSSSRIFIFDSGCTCTFNIENSIIQDQFYNSMGMGNSSSTITAKLSSGTKYYTGSVTQLKNNATWMVEEGCGTLDYTNYSIVVYDAEHYAKVKGYDSNGALTDVGYVHAPVGGTVDAATLNSLATTRASELLTDGFTRRYYTFAGWTTTENGSVVDLSTITYEDTLYPVYSIEDVDARAAEYNGEKYMTINAALQAAIDANASGQIDIKLIQDTSEFVILTEKTPNVVIDLNGKTLSKPTEGYSVYFSDRDNESTTIAEAIFAFQHTPEEKTSASLLIKDSSSNMSGHVSLGNSYYGYLFATDVSTMPSGVAITIQGGNFDYSVKKPYFKSYYITASNINITGGTFMHNVTSYVDTDDCDYNYNAGIYTVREHSYGDAEFAWSNDRSSCTVKRYCTNDGCSHCIETNATVTSTTKTNATCISQGVTTYTANITLGGNNYSDTKDITDIAIDSNNHDIVHHDAKAATCEAIGWDAYDTCSRCSYTTYVEKSALNHDYKFVEFVWDGFTAKAKYVCENDSTHIVYYNATVTNEVTTTPTCVATGVKTYTATYDGHTDTKDETLAINPDNHDIVHHDAKAATCEAIGWDAYDTCSRCSYTTYVEIPATNHNYVFDSFVWDGYTAKAKYVCENDSTHIVYYNATVTNEVTTTPTCVATGVKTYTATYDGHTDTKNETLSINPNNHDIVHHSAQAPTCEAIGWDAYDTCSRCSYTTYVEKSALNHDYKFVEFVWDGFTAKAKYVCENDSTHIVYYDATITNEVTTTPTCVATGVKTYTATYDGHTDTKDEILAINPDNHDIVHHDAKAPDCTNIGWDAYDTCSRCSYTTYVEKSALNHDYKFVEFVWDGYTAKAKYVCENDSTHIVYYNATITNEVTKTPTCVATGVKTYTATYDGHTDTKNETLAINPDNHDIVHHDAKAPDCTNIGWDAYDTCSRCSYSTYVEKGALGHKVVIDPAVPATTISTGLTEGAHCSVCKAVLEPQEVVDKLAKPATGEDIVDVVVQPGSNEVETEINSNIFDSTPAEEDNKKVVIKAGDVATIEFDSDAAKAISENADGAKISISIEKSNAADKASEIETAGVKGAKLVISFELTANDNPVFGVENANGQAVVSFEYTPSNICAQVLVYYINGNERTVVPSELKDGKLYFTAAHFSDYVIAEHETHEYHDGICECGGVAENVKFYFEVSSNNTVSLVVYDDYGAVIRLPLDGSVNTESVLIKAIMQNVSSLDVDGVKSHEITVNTGFGSKTVNLQTWLSNAYNFDGATLNISIDGHELTYTFASIDANNGIVASTDTDAARTAWQSLTSHITTSTQTEDDSFIEIANGSFLKIGTEYLRFEDGYVGNLKLDNFSDLDALETAIRAAVTLDTCADQGGDITLFVKAGTKIAVGQTVAELQDDYMIIISADPDEMDAVDGSLASLKDASGSYEMVKELVSLFNKVIGVVDACSSVEVEMHVHEFTHVTANDASCTEDGNIEYWFCENCGKYYSNAAGTVEITSDDTVIGALGHTLTHVTANAPTCVDDGNIEYWYCSECEKYFTDAEATTEITEAQTVVDALDHDRIHHDAKAPTCTDIGWDAYDTCSRCDYSTYVEIPATNHDYKFVGFVWDGFTAKAIYVCDNDASHVVFYDATITNEVTTTPTCVATGVRTYTATYDGHTDKATEVLAIDPSNHDIVHIDAKSPTCTESGWNAYDKCSRCEYSTKVEIPATNHDYKFVGFVWDGFTAKAIYVCENDADHVVFYDATITNEVTTTPTCVATGVRTYTATYDGHTDTAKETVAINPDNHAIVHVDAKDATCTESGWNAYDKCSRCEYSTKVEIPATNHDYKFVGFVWDGFTAKAIYVCENDADHVVFYDATITNEVTTTPTCVATGVRTYTATYDGHTDTAKETVAINPDNHDIVHVDAKDATCTESGWNAYDKCSRCDYSTKTEIPATNHDYKFVGFVWDGFTAKAIYVCENDADHVVFYDATVTNEVTLTPTCTCIGVKTYTATYDGNSDTKLETLAINPDNHDIVGHDGKASTCTEDGWHGYDTCSRCDYSTKVVIPATNHNYKFSEFVWDGFTAKAKYVCENDSSHVVYYDAIVTNEVTLTPTCDATGTKKYTASYDGNEDTKLETLAIDPNNHDIEHHNSKAPDCTTSGWDAYDTCSRCEYSTYVEKAALGHTLVHTFAHDADCQTTGNIEFWYCSVCEKYFSDAGAATEITQAQTVIAIKSHTPATAVKENEIAPTCKTTGSYDSVIYCSECHDQISRTTMLVTTTSHNTIHFEGKDATVYSAGNIEYWYCCECKEYFSDSACLYGISKADIEIAKLTATEVTKPTEDTTSYVYNGSEQTYVIADSDKYAVYGNKQTNAGTYTVTVSLKDKLTTCWTGGSTDDLTFSFTIAKATIDMSGVTFESDALIADGQYHSIYVNGLPINVQVSYSNNNIKNPGTYNIVASFNAGENYNAIPDMEATLTILAKSEEKKTISSDGNSVEGYLPEGSSLSVEVLNKATSEDAKVASTLVENQKNVNAKDVLAVIEVNLSYKNIEIQPNGEIKLTLKVPTNVGDNSFAVYHVHTNEDGTKTVTALDHELNGDKFSVTVDKLSQLVLVKAETSTSENNTPLFFMIGGGAIVLAVLVALIALGVNKKAHRICKSALESEKVETQEAKTEDNK